MRYFLSISLFFAITFTAAGQSHKLYPPRDEVKDSSLLKFIDSLKTAVNNKDSKLLISLLSNDISISFGDDSGIRDFINMYHPEKKDAELWPLLSKMITLGGTYMKDYPTGQPIKTTYVFPYAAERIDSTEECEGCWSCLSVIVPDANVRKEPNRLSESVGKLRYDVVKIVERPSTADDTGNWVYVETFDKKIKGWIRRDLVWDICDYRLHIFNEDNKWKITVFIAGD